MALTQISTAGVKDDAVTAGKIPANAVGSSELADNAVDTAAIANNAVNSDKIATNAVNTTEIADTAVTLAKLEHGTSSNDGKFLRANNGADPTFETVTGTTINTNADNRVITGSGTANTLNGESGLTYDGSNLNVTGGLDVSSDVSIADTIKHTGDTNTKIRFPAADNIGMEVNGSELLRITPDGVFGSEPNIRLKASTTVDHAAVQVGGSKDYSAGIPRNQLGVSDGQAYDTTDNGGAIAFHAKYHSNGAYTTMGSVEGVKNNNSSGNYEGALIFKTRVHGGHNTIGMRLINSGLCFGTDNAAANALDDYETGTAFSSTGNGTVYHATYVKVGNIVNIVFRLNVSSGNQTFSLPFAAASGDIHLGTSTNFYLNASTLTFPQGFHKGTGSYHTS